MEKTRREKKHITYHRNEIMKKGLMLFCQRKQRYGHCKEEGKSCVFIHSENEFNEFIFKLNSKFQYDACCYSFENNTTAKTCSICVQDYEKSNWIKRLKCNHIFHLDCIKNWFKTKRECPVCKANYDKKEIDLTQGFV